MTCFAQLRSAPESTTNQHLTNQARRRKQMLARQPCPGNKNQRRCTCKTGQLYPIVSSNLFIEINSLQFNHIKLALRPPCKDPAILRRLPQRLARTFFTHTSIAAIISFRGQPPQRKLQLRACIYKCICVLYICACFWQELEWSNTNGC